ncbi:hypothetical protein OS189_05830 [Sulfitobacter sp. F26169L]|uniref:COG4223 family protein n=1 Tax=Sulfitobacter sp. F26169L TaxID=2996015 RepID=UPI002260D045|nr:hypothetical protein [Sulfitobacter sp. F26169L]MCX7565856.1 hypothetical protein [Sulfitobacter sp. F26169L]
MASSKKTGPSKSKSPKSEATDSKIKDAVIVEGETSSNQSVDVAKAEDAKSKPEPEQAAKSDTVPTGTEYTGNREPDEKKSAGEKLQDDAPAAEEQGTTVAEMVHPVPVTTPVQEKRSIFLPLVLGGIIAGVIGFMAAEMDMFGNGSADITTKLRNDLNTQQERITALETAEQPAVQMPQVDLSPLEQQLSALEDRIAVLEERPVVSVPERVDLDAAEAYAAELAALKLSVETQRSEIETLLNNAKSVEEATAEAARAATIQAAVTKIISAIDAGQPFDAALAELEAVEGATIDPALGDVADDGVATLSTLQSEFPDQARKALATARASGVEEGQQGLGGFLKRSLGARSVAPREGSDPDAVLSRAEAAIKSGDLDKTLTELDTLPEEAQAAIADWRAAADARNAARAAADALAQRLTAD